MNHNSQTIAIAARQAKTHNGLARNVFEHIQSINQLNYQPTLLAEKANSQKLAKYNAHWHRINTLPLKTHNLHRFWFNYQVQRWRKRHKPNLLISHGDVLSNDCLFMHNCAALAAEKLQQTESANKHIAFHHYILKNSSPKRLVANSNLMAQDLINRYGYDPSKVEVIYPSYNPHQFNPCTARQKRHETRQSFGINESDYLIGLVTSGNYKKRNVTGFIEIAARLKQQFPQHSCQFLVVGKDDFQPYRTQLQSLNLNSDFIHLQPIQNVETLYGALDLFVLPAHFEEFGRVALEAFASGTPTLISDQVGASELLKPHHPDLILPLNYDQWAQKIGQMLGAGNLKGLGENLADLAKYYDEQAQHGHHIHLLNNLMNS